MDAYLFINTVEVKLYVITFFFEKIHIFIENYFGQLKINLYTCTRKLNDKTINN